jgi:hypothetical protein
MQSGGQLDPHIHEQGWISGSLYLTVPPPIDNAGGNLVLSLTNKRMEPDPKNEETRIIQVSNGLLCLFPSSLYHYTLPFKNKQNRLVLAFDVVPVR